MKKRGKEIKRQSFYIRNPLKVGAISGIGLAVLFLISMFLAPIIGANPIYSIIYSIIFYTLLILFMYAFYVIGKVYKNKLLKIMSLIFIIFFIISWLIFQVGGMAMGGYGEELQNKLQSAGITDQTENLTDEQATVLLDEILPTLLPLIIFFLIYGVVMLIFTILFGVGLIKLGPKVKYAKVAGILEVIGAGSVILIVGLMFFAAGFVFLAAYVLEIILLFKESKKLKL